MKTLSYRIEQWDHHYRQWLTAALDLNKDPIVKALKQIKTTSPNYKYRVVKVTITTVKKVIKTIK